MKGRFREICEDQFSYDNKNFKIRILRVFIRYLVRTLGLNNSKNFLDLIYIFFKRKNFSYYEYLLKINIFRIQYLILLSKNNFVDAIITKKIWANYVKKNSISKVNKANSNYYLSVVNGDFNFEEVQNNNKDCKKFYIYGPGCNHPPNSVYSDFTLVNLKPFPEELPAFKEEIIFLNSFYFLNEVAKNEEKIKYFISRYSNVYVACATSEIPKEFERIEFSDGGYLSSEMNLQRILCFLYYKYGKYECVIEGFNLYLDENPYKNKDYHKLTRTKSGNILEKEICMSLADHDFLFNFILTKKLAKKITLVESDEFKNIISLNTEEYLQKLFKARNFNSLSRLT